MAGSFLNNLAPMQGQPEQAQNRALLQAGLAMQQPINPLTGGDQFTNGIQAGLNSLDAQEALRVTAAQQTFDNNIATGAADLAALTQRQGNVIDTTNAASNTSNAASNTVNAAANTVNAQTGVTNAASTAATVENQDAQAKATLKQAASEFDRLAGKRFSERVLNMATARMRDRLPVDGSGGSGGRTAADVDVMAWKAKMLNMWQQDQQLPAISRRFPASFEAAVERGDLQDEAWTASIVREGSAGSDSLAVVSANTDDAGELGLNMLAAADPQMADQLNKEKPSPEEATQAQQLFGWSGDQWRAAIQANDPQVDRLLKMFPGLHAQAVKSLTN